MERNFHQRPDQRFDERAVRADDEFLTALSRGIDPSNGSDPLAAALLDLRADVEAPMPAAPLLEDTERGVVSLDSRRAARSRRQTNPWVAGLVGAAAATVVVAGTGAALFNAEPGSPLWGPSQALFGERADIVELASALDEIEVKAENGDVDGARNLIEQLRNTLTMSRAGSEAHEVTPVAPHTTEHQAEPAPEPESQEPGVVTVTQEPVTVTVTVTHTPQTSVTTPEHPTSTVVSVPPTPTPTPTPTPAP